MTTDALTTDLRFELLIALSTATVFIIDADELGGHDIELFIGRLRECRIEPIALVRFTEPDFDAVSRRCNELEIGPVLLLKNKTPKDFINAICDHLEISGCISSSPDLTVPTNAVGGIALNVGVADTADERTMKTLFRARPFVKRAYRRLLNSNRV